jgi:hypothetical protein
MKNIKFSIDNEIKQIYYKYFYNNCDVFFKTSVLYGDVYKTIQANKELFSFLSKINLYQDSLNINISDKELAKYIFIFNDSEEKYKQPFAIFIILLEEFEKKEFYFNGYDKNKLNINLNLIVDIYKKRDYDLYSEVEFNKYNLLEITNNRKLFWQEPRVIDKEYEITFDIKYINHIVYLKIIDLYNSYNFKLSFYPNCLNARNYIDTTYMTFDEKEYGKKYNIDDIKKIKLKENTKFVDYKVENKFYVKLVENELTFEEIQKDINIFDGSNVIYTKVVHVIFLIEDEILYIKHIDLEYIFYTLDEYIERFDNDNFEQKGSKYKRQKIFKIDNAKINLVENLYDLIYNSMDNKNLIDEYFEMINQNKG